MPKLQLSKKKNSNRGSLWVIIPSDIAKLKGWKKGTVLEFKEASRLNAPEMMGAVCIVEVR